MSDLFIILITLFLLSGCGVKEQKTVFKEVLVPVKCPAQMPLKPVNNGTFDSHKKIMIYYLECENTLKYCLGIKDE